MESYDGVGVRWLAACYPFPFITSHNGLGMGCLAVYILFITRNIKRL